MSEKKHRKWLHIQLPQWIALGLIDQTQADSITRHYQQQADGGLGRSVFSALAALMFGLGIILFFAYNWQEMHRFLKLFIIFSSIIAANSGALWFTSSGRNNHAASEGLALLGSVLFGAAIWLISQIYHIDEHMPNGILLWALGVLFMAWARLSFIQCVAAIVLLGAWGSMEIFGYHYTLHYSPWVILLGAGGLAWVLRSPVLLFLSITMFYFLWTASLFRPLGEGLIYLILSVSLCLIAIGMLLHRMHNEKYFILREALLIPGFAVYLSIVFAMTFINSHRIEPFDTSFQSIFFWASLGASLFFPSLIFAPVKNWLRAMETDRLHASLLLTTAFLFFTVGSGWWNLPSGLLSGAMNLIFIGHCLLFISHGSRIQRGWEVALGCILSVALIFARYTDLFDSLLSRSLVFLILGASLFVVGNFYARHKKESAA